MGFRRNNFRGHNKERGSHNESKAQRNWTELVKENEKWEEYYKALGIIPEEEWDAFKKTFQAQLPLTFRITGFCKHADEVLSLFEKDHLPNLTDVEWEGEKIEGPKPLSWYLNNMAWQLDVSKSVIRKNQRFARMQRFLVLENAVGNISRQEAVSMIPPIVLRIESHHSVLDMCAAPGSKTAQIIEALHANSAEPSGFVVANDADYRRSHMLVHQLKRLNSANLIVVNHDAQFFPRIKLSIDSKDFLKFDRVLCDVPCSGDGTMRKNINVWKDWSTGSGLGLHSVQLNILNRGLALLKNNGRLVYSTCSLNPIENEAVVAAALRKWGSEIRLVDCDNMLPGLVRSKGIFHWPVFDKNFVVKERGSDETVDSWFPPTEDEISEFNLDRCIRIYPHQQNTGGFFISVIEKVGTEINGQSDTNIGPEPKKIKTETVPFKKEKLPRDANEEPFVFVDPNHPMLTNSWNFYGIDDLFEKKSCLVRNATGEPTRVVYYVATPIRHLIQANAERLKIVYSGVKLFVSQRSDISCPWRIQSESLPIIRHHMNENRVVDANLELFKLLLQEAFPRFEDLEKSHIDDNFVMKMKSLSAGCAFVRVHCVQGKEPLFLPVWNGSNCINLMLSKENTCELLYRIFGIETTGKDKPKTDAHKNELSATLITDVQSSVSILKTNTSSDNITEVPCIKEADQTEEIKSEASQT